MGQIRVDDARHVPEPRGNVIVTQLIDLHPCLHSIQTEREKALITSKKNPTLNSESFHTVKRMEGEFCEFCMKPQIALFLRVFACLTQSPEQGFCAKKQECQKELGQVELLVNMSSLQYVLVHCIQNWQAAVSVRTVRDFHCSSTNSSR